MNFLLEELATAIGLIILTCSNHTLFRVKLPIVQKV